MVSNFLSQVNLKSLIICVIAVFIYIFVSDFLIHGMAMKEAYANTDYLWRNEKEMQDFFLWMLLGQFLIAKFFCMIYARGYEGQGVKEGLRFAGLMAPLILAPNFIWYAVMPLPLSIVLAWVGYGYIQILGAGLIAGLIYKK